MGLDLNFGLELKGAKEQVEEPFVGEHHRVLVVLHTVPVDSVLCSAQSLTARRVLPPWLKALKEVYSHTFHLKWLLSAAQAHTAERNQRIDMERLRKERDLLESKFESNLKWILLTLRDESVDVEAVKAILKERLKQRAEEWVNEQTADVLLPHTVEEIVEVVKLVRQDRVQQRIVEQPVRPINWEVVGVVKEKRCVSQDKTERVALVGEKYREENEGKIEAENGSKSYVWRVQERVIEETIDVPLPQNRLSDRIIEQTVDVAVPEIREQNDEAVEPVKHAYSTGGSAEFLSGANH